MKQHEWNCRNKFNPSAVVNKIRKIKEKCRKNVKTYRNFKQFYQNLKTNVKCFEKFKKKFRVYLLKLRKY